MIEAVVGVAISVLAAVFIGSFIALVLVCRHKYCRKADHITRNLQENRPEVHLIDTSHYADHSAVELNEVQLTHPHIEEILNDERWVDDITGLIPHCLEILKVCHHLTEKLVAMTMGNSSPIHNNKKLAEIVDASRRIIPRVDDVVRSMFPPLDPRLLDARTQALILCVNHLVVVTKHACHAPTDVDWIDNSLQEMDSHHRVLREAAITVETNAKRALDQQHLLNNCHEASQL